MAKTLNSDDPEQLFIHNLIALTGFIIDRADQALDECDDPEIIDAILSIQRDAIMVRVRVRDYEPRLNRLKLLARSTGRDLRPHRTKKRPVEISNGPHPKHKEQIG